MISYLVPRLPRLKMWLTLFGLAIAAFTPKAHAFTHPGVLSVQKDLDFVKAKVAAGTQPWKGSWDRLVANSHSSSTYTPHPLVTVIRGGDGQNYANLYNDIAAAYQNALRWKIGGTTANGDKARDIINAWSSTMTTLTGNADRFLASGIYGYELAAAVELMRGYNGFNLGAAQNLLRNVFYPLCHQFLVNHNDACITNYWANWDLANMAAILAIGIVCDDQPKFDEAISYFKNGAGNGSINHAVWLMHSSVLGQWQESGRDQGHTMLGMALMGAFCEIAWNQGQDMYGYNSNRFMAGANYVAQYNLGNSVPYSTYNWGSGQNCTAMSQTAISSASRGQDRPIWDLIHNHYNLRKGLNMPNLASYASRVGPDGGGGEYGTDSGGYDQLGFTTLTCYGTAGGSGSGGTSPIAAGTYSLKNRASGKCLDNLGSTADGAIVAQWADGTSNNQKWVLSYVGSNAKLTCVTGGKCLDSINHTADGSTVAQWATGGSLNQQWTIQNLGTGYYKVINVANGKCLDTGGGTADGAQMQFWPSGTSNNQQWQFVAP